MNQAPLQPATAETFPAKHYLDYFEPHQHAKVQDIIAKAEARARKPYLKPCMLAKRALEFGRLQLAASRKLLAHLTT